MGEHGIGASGNRPHDTAPDVRAVLRDLGALEHMLREGLVESDVHRIGAEQEMFLIHPDGTPAPVAPRVLQHVSRPDFTSELGQFNLEINLSPRVLGGTCFTRLEESLREAVGAAQGAARECGADVALTGILPTLAATDLTLENMTPDPRYLTLNDAVVRLRNGPGRLHVHGTDELHLETDSVMAEACTASFQVHLQVSARAFAQVYNTAMLVSAPVLASAVNSPLMLGKRLWAETRIPVFQQSVDTRRMDSGSRVNARRVRFGENWASESIVDLYREDLVRFPVLLGLPGHDEDSMAELQAGRMPSLRALQIYNSTVYRWNRPCFGVTDGVPHLRIECRYLPSGPSIIDEVANATF